MSKSIKSVTHHRNDYGRVDRARELVAQLLILLPPRSKARRIALALNREFSHAPSKNIQAILLRVPGSTHTERAERIGISKQSFSKLWHRRFAPGPDVAKRIAKLAGVPEEDLR